MTEGCATRLGQVISGLMVVAGKYSFGTKKEGK